MADFFDDRDEGEVRRDRKGRPLLLPHGGSTRAPYTRASGLADHIENKAGVHRWEMRYLARGMGVSPDLCELAAAETYNTGFDMVDVGANKASGRELDKIIERAHDRVFLHEKADRGTAIHKLTEPGNTGTAISGNARNGLAAFQIGIRQRGIAIGATELFVANDTVMSAGTFDHLIWHKTLGYVIADKKTGKMNPFEFCIQLSIYANGELYDVDTDERCPLESLTKGNPINRAVGLVIWIHDGECDFKLVNLEAGWEMAQHAAAVRDYHERTDLMGDF